MAQIIASAIINIVIGRAVNNFFNLFEPSTQNSERTLDKFLSILSNDFTHKVQGVVKDAFFDSDIKKLQQYTTTSSDAIRAYTNTNNIQDLTRAHDKSNSASALIYSVYNNTIQPESTEVSRKCSSEWRYNITERNAAIRNLLAKKMALLKAALAIFPLEALSLSHRIKQEPSFSGEAITRITRQMDFINEVLFEYGQANNLRLATDCGWRQIKMRISIGYTGEIHLRVDGKFIHTEKYTVQSYKLGFHQHDDIAIRNGVLGYYLSSGAYDKSYQEKHNTKLSELITSSLEQNFTIEGLKLVNSLMETRRLFAVQALFNIITNPSGNNAQDLINVKKFLKMATNASSQITNNYLWYSWGNADSNGGSSCIRVNNNNKVTRGDSDICNFDGSFKEDFDPSQGYNFTNWTYKTRTLKSNIADALIHIASENKRPDIMKLLRNYGADINSLNATGETVLHSAVRSGDKPTIKYALKKGVDVLKADNNGVKPSDLSVTTPNVHHEIIDAVNKAFKESLLNNDIARMNLAIASGADVNSYINTNHDTPLHHAISTNNQAMLQALLNTADIDILKTNVLNKTPRAYALAQGYPALAALFDQPLKDLFIKEAGKCDTDRMALCISDGVDINHIDNNGETGLFHAMRSHTNPNCQKAINWLLNNNIDVLKRNKANGSPMTLQLADAPTRALLHPFINVAFYNSATAANSTRLDHALQDAADLYYKDPSTGNTVLHGCVLGHDVNCARLILNHNNTIHGNIRVNRDRLIFDRNDNNQTARELAKLQDPAIYRLIGQYTSQNRNSTKNRGL